MAHAQPTLGELVKECGGAKAELHKNDDTWEVKEAERGWTWALCVDLGRRAPFYPPHHQQSYCLRAQVLEKSRTNPSSASPL